MKNLESTVITNDLEKHNEADRDAWTKWGRRIYCAGSCPSRMYPRGESTREEALKNIQEAIELYLEPVEDDLVLQSEAELLELVVWPKFPALDMTKSCERSRETVRL